MIYALGIGSNSNSRFGNKLNTLKFVIKELERNNIKVIKKSKLYSSPPKNFKTAAETFLNAALVVETKLKPKNLLIMQCLRNEFVGTFLVYFFFSTGITQNLCLFFVLTTFYFNTNNRIWGRKSPISNKLFVVCEFGVYRKVNHSHVIGNGE